MRILQPMTEICFHFLETTTIVVAASSKLILTIADTRCCTSPPFPPHRIAHKDNWPEAV